MKQEEHLEGKRGEPVSAMEELRPCAPVSLTGPGPRKPYQLTAVAVGHVRSSQAPCAHRDTQARRCSLDINSRRTAKVESSESTHERCVTQPT